MKILLIRLRLIGDVVFTTPLVRALRRTFPQARLTYLVEQNAAPVVAGNPHLDRVVVAGATRGLARIREDLSLARQLRRERFDIVFDLHGGPRSSWLTWATGAPERIGYDVQGRGWQYTRRVFRARELKPRHSVVNQWDLLTALDGWSELEPDAARDAVQMAPAREAVRRIDERLQAAGVTDHHALIIVHVSAGNPFRRWPEPAFTALVATLAAASPDRRIVLSSGPSDRPAAGRIADDARRALGPSHADRVLQFGDVDLAELRALIDRSRLFVGGDTGPLHIASTTETPIVGIYGPTMAARSAPWRDPRLITESLQIEDLPCRPCEQRVCAPGDFRCLTTLTPESVIAAAERALARGATIRRAAGDASSRPPGKDVKDVRNIQDVPADIEA